MANKLFSVISVKNSIEETIKLNFIKNSGFIYKCEMDSLKELKIFNNKIIFEELLIELFRSSNFYYNENCANKIVLIIGKIENNKEFSISITTGESIIFENLDKFQKNKDFLKDNYELININKIKKIVSIFFNGHVEIISKFNKGKTIKCFFKI